MLPICSQITAIKAYIPPNVVPNQIFEQRFGLPPGFIESKTGVLARRHADPSEYPTKMGVRAANMVFDEAGITPQDVDMIISAATSRDQSIPTDAMLYANLLGIPNVQCLHVEAVCLSFVNALEIADLYIRSGKRKSILIITAEQTSRVIDYDDPASSILLGDGAAAALVTPSTGASRVEASYIKTEALGRNVGVATIDGGGLRHHPSDPDFTRSMLCFHVDGALELKLALTHFPPLLEKLFQMAGCTLDDIDHVIPHQVIPRMIRTVLGSISDSADNAEKVHINTSYGNQAAACIPIGLAELVACGKVKRGDRLLLIGGAAGFSLGGIILVY